MPLLMISRIIPHKIIKKTLSDVFRHGSGTPVLILLFTAGGGSLIFALQYSLTSAHWGVILICSLLYVWAVAATLAVFRTCRQARTGRAHPSAPTESVERKSNPARAQHFQNLGEITASVSHELNNLLSGVATYPEVLMMDQHLTPKIRDGLEMIQDAGKNASAVVRDLLTIAQCPEAKKESLNLNQIFERYLASREYQQVQKGHFQVVPEIFLDPELLPVAGSYFHIEKIMTTLLFHAVKAVAGRENAGVWVKTANLLIDAKNLTTAGGISPGRYVLFSVWDTGPKIDEDILSQVFDPYFARNGQEKKSSPGLGLAVVWHLVQDHGGFVNLVSDEDQTRFEILFPAQPDGNAGSEKNMPTET